jgi:hypothetical protein
MRPKIFIGSSSLGYESAKEVKKYLESFADCTLWKDPGIWEPNRSTFQNLLRMSCFFDFGVFIATSDDLTFTNNKIVIEPRDNVILEMALFLGALGKDKAFLFVEEDIKLPSDFNGIYMPRFNSSDSNTIKNAVDEYIIKIEENYRLGYLSLYPTTALAIGYYKNFISGIVDSIQNAEKLNFEGTEYSEFELKVIIPQNLEGIIREKATLFYKRHGFVESTLKTKFRRHPTWFQLDSSNAPKAIMYDMPSTLTGIYESIEMILEKGYIGRTKMQEIIEQRELNNFRRVLQIQIDKSPLAKSIVEIVYEF